MSNEHAVWYSFLLYALYVLLPIIPAAVLFKLFPDTKVAASGPLQNLNVKTTGAFAGYVVTVLLGFLLIQNVERQIEKMVDSALDTQAIAVTWSAAIPIELRDGDRKPITAKVNVNSVNLDPNLFRSGDGFVYVTFSRSPNGDWPTLYLGVPGFEAGVLDLQRLLDSKDVKKVVVERDKRRLAIKEPVVLTALGSALASEYKEAEPLPSLNP